MIKKTIYLELKILMEVLIIVSLLVIIWTIIYRNQLKNTGESFLP